MLQPSSAAAVRSGL